jgi:hypothetical protein
MPVEHLFGGLAQDPLGEYGGTGAEVENTGHKSSLLSGMDTVTLPLLAKSSLIREDIFRGASYIT